LHLPIRVADLRLLLAYRRTLRLDVSFHTVPITAQNVHCSVQIAIVFDLQVRARLDFVLDPRQGFFVCEHHNPFFDA
jgi:hypothetical protein